VLTEFEGSQAAGRYRLRKRYRKKSVVLIVRQRHLVMSSDVLLRSRRSARFFSGDWIMIPSPVTLIGASPTEICGKQLGANDLGRLPPDGSTAWRPSPGISIRTRCWLGEHGRFSLGPENCFFTSRRMSRGAGRQVRWPYWVRARSGRRCDRPISSASGRITTSSCRLLVFSCSTPDDCAGSERSSTDRRVNTVVDNRNGTRHDDQVQKRRDLELAWCLRRRLIAMAFS